MNFTLVPMPAPEELALGNVPSASSNRMIAVLSLLALFVIFQLPLGNGCADAPSDTAETASLAEAFCEGCIQTPPSSDQIKD